MTALQLSVIAPRNCLVALRKQVPVPTFRSAAKIAASILHLTCPCRGGCHLVMSACVYLCLHPHLIAEHTAMLAAPCISQRPVDIRLNKQYATLSSSAALL